MSWLLGPRSKWTALVLGALLPLPFLATGLFADDYYHQLLIERTPGVPGTPWSQFTFATGDPRYLEPLVTNGPWSWWVLDEVRFIFLRPLSAGLAILDHALFGRAFAWHHLHSLAWYVGLVAVVVALFRRAFRGAVALGALAGVLFALDDAHALVAGWIANRNAAVATLPALLGLLAHVRWREDGWRPGLSLSLLGVATGLAGGESALGAVAYLLAYELTVAPGPWRARALSLAPLAGLGVLYIAIYRWQGAGAYGSGIYMDPLREPLQYLGQAPVKVLVLLGAQFLGAPADMWLAAPPLRPVLVASGVLAVLLVGALVRAVWTSVEPDERRGLLWLSVGGALSSLPVLATFPLNRLLLMPSIGGSALLAVVLLRGWRAASGWTRAGARLLFFSTVVMALLGWLVVPLALRHAATQLLATANETTLTDAQLSGRVYVFVAPDPAAAIYTPQVRAWQGKPPRAWLTFSFALAPHRLTRLDARRFELEVVGGRMMETLFEQLQRAERFPVPLGFTRRLNGVEVKVTGLDQGLPNKVELTFDAAPEESGDTFVEWKGGRAAPLALPAVGEVRELPQPESPLQPRL